MTIILVAAVVALVSVCALTIVLGELWEWWAE